MTGSRRRASLKLTALLALGIGVLWITTLPALAAVLALVGATAAIGRVSPRELWRHTRVVVPVVVTLFVWHGVVAGWLHAGVVSLRIGTVVVAASIVTMTTRVSDILGVVEVACWPLRRVGVDPTRVGLVLAMTIRLVPVLGDKLAAIRQAQRARGVERPGVTLLSPLLVGTLRMADDLADALDARGLADARELNATEAGPG